MPKKVLLPLILMVAAIGWVATTNLSKANYFYNVHELPEMGDPIFKKGLKVKGRILAGSIEKENKPVKFIIQEEDKHMKVHYIGEEPLPDMFKDHAETVVEGKMRTDGVFEAVHVQAKCASKYEAMAPDVAAGQAEQPVQYSAPTE